MITVKEEFLGSVKTKLAIKLGGYEILAVWLAMKGYADGSLTGGFVPNEVMDDLPGMPKSWRKLMKALLECGKLKQDGTRGPGLVEETELGWRLHDYIDHASPIGREELRRQKERDRKANWRAGQRTGHVPGQRTGQNEGQETGQESGHVPVTSRAGADAQPSRARDPSPAQPRSDQPDTTTQRPESSKSAGDAEGGGGSSKIPCPANLKLADGQRRTLEVAMIPGWAIDSLTVRFVANHQADPSDRRPFEAWLKCLSQAIVGWWNNPRTRPKPPEPAQSRGINLADLGIKVGAEGL